jgi:adenylate kinase family enzyme
VQRVAILGSGGAGKSALAARIAAHTGLPVVHLDVLYWQPGWKPPPQDEFDAKLDAAVAEERWILDGNFLRHDSPDPRFARADAVVFLDLPRTTCLWRVLKRRLQEARASRRDLPDGCRESIDLEFLRWVWRYPRRNRPRVLTLLDGLDGVTVHRLRSNVDVERFVASL